MHYCEWCGDPHDDEDHEVIVNLHMHTRTMPELVRDAFTEAECLIEQLPRGRDRDRATNHLNQVEALIETTDDEDDGLEIWAENLDHVEAIVNDHIPGLLAISDGGATGDWLVVTKGWYDHAVKELTGE